MKRPARLSCRQLATCKSCPRTWMQLRRQLKTCRSKRASPTWPRLSKWRRTCSSWAPERVLSSVLTVTDGKPSFAWMTNEMVEQLDDKSIMRYFVVVNNQGPTSDVMKQMQQWASQPWETNLIHIPGILVLAADYELWAQKALVKFCPNAYSPTVETHYEESYGYAHVKDSAWCGEFNDKTDILSTTAADAEACASLAQGAGAHCFLLGAFFLRGTCARCSLTADEVTSVQYTEWQDTKRDPECTFGSGWHSSMFYDFYAMEPAGSKDSKI